MTALHPPAEPHGRAAGTWHALVSMALAVLGFFMPFSSAGVSLSLAALLVLALCRPGLVLRVAPWRDPVMATGLLLLAWIALHTLATTGWTGASAQAINQYHELLFAPMLFVLMRDARHRLIFLRSLFTGATVLAIAHWAGFSEPAIAPFLGQRRISAGFALAVCAFLLLMRSRGRPGPWPSRIVAAFMALTVLYAIEGRTGHLVLLVLVACAAWTHSPPRWRWPVSIGSSLLVVALAMSSSAVGGRVKETLASVNDRGQTVQLTSTTIRIALVQLGADLAQEHWLTGAGYARYAQVHAKAAQARFGDTTPNAPWMRNANPHNEYLMHLIGGGVASLGLFLAWLALTFRSAVRSSAHARPQLAGVALAFAIGCVFNSLLLDFVEGHLYMGLVAWLLAEARFAPLPDRRAVQVNRILIVATRQIGDVLLTTPLVQAARARWPAARIEVLGFEGTLGMLAGNPAIDALVPIPARLGPGGALRLVRQLWRRHDFALVTDPGDRAHLIGWVAAPTRAGIVPQASSSNWWKEFMLDHAVKAAGDLGERHVVQEKLALIEPWLPAGEPVARVVPPPAAALPAGIDDIVRAGAVVVHSPSMWPYKQWPIAHFRELVAALLADGRQVVLTGSGGERDRECIAALRGLAPSPQLVDAGGRLDFNQLAALFARAGLYVGPDTSVSHLAAACGVPVLAIFGPTNPQRWAPWPAVGEARFERVVPIQQAGNVTLLQASLPCVPCGRAGCEDHRGSRSDCLQSITPQRVIEEARKLLARDGGQQVARPT